MAVAKVILNGTTLIDTTQKTVTAGSMLNGVTALKNDGTDITGNIASKTSSDLTASGATVTAPAGYYASSASKSVSSGSAATPATTITANPSISVSSGGLITASVSASQNVTPTVSAGYVSSGTAGTVSVSGSNTSQLTTQAAQTITPTTTNQTIASGKYLTGTQTIEGIVCTNLTAENIADGVTVKIGTATDDDSVASVTGTHQGGGGGTTTVTAAADNSTYAYIDGDGVFQRIAAIPLPEEPPSITMNVMSGSLITRYASSTTAVTITNATSQARSTSSSGTIRCVQLYVAD